MVIDDVVQELKGKPFGINPSSVYSRKSFVRNAKKLFDVEDAYKRLGESHLTDRGALEDLIKIGVDYADGTPEDNKTLWRAQPSVALDQGKALLDAGYEKTALFVANHRHSLLDKLSAEQLYALFSSVPLYKTGDKEHDNAAEIRNKVARIQEAANKGNDVGAVVAEEVEALVKNSPKEQQEYIMRNSHVVIPTLKNSVAKAMQKAFSKLFRDERGELNKTALIKYLERNYKVAENFIDEAPDEEKADYWGDNLKLQYVEIARQLYGSEDKAQKLKDNPEKEVRKAKAKGLGLIT